jgi:hypothetical protein
MNTLQYDKLLAVEEKIHDLLWLLSEVDTDVLESTTKDLERVEMDIYYRRAKYQKQLLTENKKA